jgi:hypothetical protein
MQKTQNPATKVVEKPGFFVFSIQKLIFKPYFTQIPRKHSWNLIKSIYDLQKHKKSL